MAKHKRVPLEEIIIRPTINQSCVDAIIAALDECGAKYELVTKRIVQVEHAFDQEEGESAFKEIHLRELRIGKLAMCEQLIEAVEEADNDNKKPHIIRSEWTNGRPWYWVIRNG